MIAVAHTLAGSAIASEVESLPIIIILGIVSHFALDALPHLDEAELEKKYNYKAALAAGFFDFLISILLVILIIIKVKKLSFLPLLLAVLAATSIDLLDNMPVLSNYLHALPFFKQLHNFHQKIQEPGMKYRFSLGIITQAVVIGISIYFLLK